MIYAFGDCVLNTQLYTVHRAGHAIYLRPKVFQVLCYLLEHRDCVVSKQELCEHVWPEQFIRDATLGSTLWAVRQALGDTGHTQRLIQTVHGHGYRFVATVGEGPVPAPATSAGAAETAPGGEPQGEARRLTPETAPRLPPVRALAGERKLVTVLCGAVEPAAPGGTSPATCPPALATVAQEVVAQYGGTLLPMVDEVLLAVFGLPVAHEDHAQRAVLAALCLQEALGTPAAGAGLGAGRSVRLGVYTGAMAVGGIAEGEALATVVVGEPLTQAVALQVRAAPGMILCSPATARPSLRGTEARTSHLARAVGAGGSGAGAGGGDCRRAGPGQIASSSRIPP